MMLLPGIKRGLRSTPFLAGAALAVSLSCFQGQEFRGTVLEPPLEATPFQLHDQFGRPTSLGNFSGKIVALTFLYTNCPDVCPLTAEALRKAHAALGDDADGAAFLAITVDPTRDTVEQVHSYSTSKGMLDKWRFLTGSADELEQVWQGYFVAAEAYRGGDGGATERLSQAALAEETHLGAVSPYLVTHQAPVYLIDRKGYIRVLHSDVTADVEPLVKDMRTLLQDQR